MISKRVTKNTPSPSSFRPLHCSTTTPTKWTHTHRNRRHHQAKKYYKINMYVGTSGEKRANHSTRLGVTDGIVERAVAHLVDRVDVGVVLN